MSASRQEMVGQLLKDIVEAADSPALNSASAAFDRFGFRIAPEGEEAEQEGLEEKAERLRRQVEDASDNVTTEIENLERKWEDAISSLTNGKVPFTVTSDIKRLLRLGIPISQRVSWGGGFPIPGILVRHLDGLHDRN